jgi:hypothetical protein
MMGGAKKLGVYKLRDAERSYRQRHGTSNKPTGRFGD